MYYVNSGDNKREGLDTADVSLLQDFIKEVLEKSLSHAENMLRVGDPSRLEDHILNSISESLKTVGQIGRKDTLKRNFLGSPQFFEIHGFSIIRIKVPRGIEEKGIRVFVKGSDVIVKWGVDGKEQVIPIPPGVEKDRAIAIVKNNILEIRFPKGEDQEIRDIGIHYY